MIMNFEPYIKLCHAFLRCRIKTCFWTICVAQTAERGHTNLGKERQAWEMKPNIRSNASFFKASLERVSNTNIAAMNIYRIQIKHIIPALFSHPVCLEGMFWL